jgi:hypothetical protein
MDLRDPIAVALGAAEALRASGTAYALYGGLLLAAYGEARETRDADLAVVRADPGSTALLLEERLGVRCLVAFESQRFGGVVVSRITLLEGDELNTVDLVTPADHAYAERALGRAVESTLREHPVRVLTPEDFVVFKLLSTRERDLDDARSVLSGLGSDLDAALVDAEVGALAPGLPHPLAERWSRVRG